MSTLLDPQVYHSFLKLMLNRESYYKYVNAIKPESMPSEVQTLLKDFDYYFTDIIDTDEIDIESFLFWFTNVRHKTYTPDLIEVYAAILRLICGAKTEHAEKLIEQFNLEVLKTSIVESFNKDKNVNNVIELCTEYVKSSKSGLQLDKFKEDIFQEDDLVALKDRQVEWRLSCLNESIGKIGMGEFGIVFAGTNAGKTSFLCSEVSHMLHQVNGKILWFYNEGSFFKLKYRFMSACLKKTNQDLLADQKKTQKEYLEYCKGDKDKINFFNATTLSIYDIEQIVNAYKPVLVIIDQLDNLAGFEKSARDDIRALKLYQRTRSIAINNNCAIIVADQATNTEGVNKISGEKWYKRYLTKEQLQGSRIAKQSTADFMIGLGYDPTERDTRFITTPKVKSIEGSNDNEMQRQAYFERQYSLYRDHFDDSDPV